MKLHLGILFLFLALFSLAQTNSSYEKIKKLHDDGNLQEVIDQGSDELKKLQTTDPVYKDILRLRADCYMELSKYSLAIADFKTLTELDPKEPANYLIVAFLLWDMHDDANCFIYLQKAYDVDPKDAGTLNNLCYYYGQVGKYEESIKYANTALEQAKLDRVLKGSLLNNRGYVYIQLKQFDKAIADINESILFHPDNSFAYCYRALANIGLNNMETVCKDLETARSMGAISLTKDLLEKHCAK